MADTDKRTYSDPSYGGHQTITFGGPSGATQTLGSNGVYACHQFMYPARVIGGRVRVGGIGDEGAVLWRTGIEDCTEIGIFGGVELLKSTDSGTGLESTVVGTADFLGASGTWDMTDAGLSYINFENVTATDFNAGDFIIFTFQGGWEDPISLFVDVEVYEKFQNTDN
jgi:hypothetical protein